MTIMDYKDMLDAQEDIKRAERHRDSNSILAYRDRLEARKARKRIVQINKLDAEIRERYAGRFSSNK